jgi:amidophosphoribosyltransferase
LKINEECGVFGIWNNNAEKFNTAQVIFFGMIAIQHRGQHSAGIAVIDKGKLKYYKEKGLVTEVFNDATISCLQGTVGIGHVGYAKQEEDLYENKQPFTMRYSSGQMAVSFNGAILNAAKLRNELEKMGYFSHTTSDAEIIAALISRERLSSGSIEEAIKNTMDKINGAFSMLVLTPSKLIAARDRHGMKPICMGFLDDSIVFSSETSAIETIGADFERDLRPGEIVSVHEGRITTHETKKKEKTAICIFEYVYLARADSDIDGLNVYDARFNAGKCLADEYKIDADIVIGAPDSGIPTAMGYAEGSGIPYGEGIIKNRYIGRTFIELTQELRERSVMLKLRPLRSRIEGKRVVLIDDSIVRGTTSRQLVQMLKEKGGAKEVHMLVASPPIWFSCKYGIDTPDEEMLISNNHSKEEIMKLINADSLGFISMEGLLKSVDKAKCGFCTACFDGVYPITGG